MHYEALKLFYQFADLEKKSIIDGPLRKNAEEYLQCYLKVIDEHFPNLKDMFSPRGVSFHLSLTTERSLPDNKEAIGFLGVLDIKERIVTAYGFRPIGKSEEKILGFFY